jgi:hypothetical protein
MHAFAAGIHSWISGRRNGHGTIGRTQGQYGDLPFVGTRTTCTVSFRDSEGILHSVDVGAETFFEAAMLALKSFREHDCAPGQGRISRSR